MPVVNPAQESPSPPPSYGRGPVQDSTRQLAQIFTGQRVATPAMGSPVQGKVVSATLTNVVVTIDTFLSVNLPQPTFTGAYEPRWYWNGTANVRVPPPTKGTPCLVIFPPNTTNIWVTSFTGWPTE
jgi:hypothetical protein